MDHDVAIIGGGIVGSILSLDLAKQGFSVALVDKSSRNLGTSKGNRYFALSLGSCNYLRSVGLEEIIKKFGEPITSVKVIEKNLGDGISHEDIELSPFQIGAESFGCMIPENSLAKEINKKIKTQKTLDVIPNTAVDFIDRSTGNVVLYSNNKSLLKVKLVTISDGQQSDLSKQSGFSYITKDYKQTAITCTLTHTKTNLGVACQYFLPSGPLALLPIGKNEICVVWTSPSQKANQLKELNKFEFETRLKPYLDDSLGDFSLSSKLSSWPLSMVLSNRITQKRVVLAGDAIRKIHPLAGQGLNLGMRDSAALVEVLVEACQRGEDIGFDTVLERYQRWRQFDSTIFTGITDSFNWIYQQNSFEFRLLRKFGVSLLNRIPTLKGLLIKEAAGLAGDIPKAMR